MAGFFGLKGSGRVPKPSDEVGLLNDYFSCPEIYVERHLGIKFCHDKVFCNNEDYFVAIDGIILNSKSLLEKYHTEHLFEAIVSLYQTFGEKFIVELNGNFCGVFSDLKNDIHLIFNNIAGSKNVFYSLLEGQIIFGSDINYLINYYHQSGMDYTLNEQAVKSMLRHPYLDGDMTFFEEIKRLHHGYFIIIKNNIPEVIQYYDYIRKPIEGRSEEEILREFDELIKRAAKAAFEKDNEYGYKHIVCLSAGLDCKMVNHLGHALGYSDDITNVTYSQSDFWDEIVPQQIARDLGHKYIFQSLDHGLFHLDIDGNVKDNAGCYYYSGIAQAKEAFHLINMDLFGLIHTGLFSDITRGRFAATKDVNYYYYLVGSNSENTQFVGLSKITEIYSPFFDKELLEFSMSIPWDLRKDSKLYNQWIINMYPQVASYVWDRTHAPLNEKMVVMPWNKRMLIPKSRVFKYLKNLAYRKMTGRGVASIGNSMNPLDYWYETSERYRKNCDRYFDENIDRLFAYPELRDEAESVYQNASNTNRMSQRAQVLTILGVFKNYFD